MNTDAFYTIIRTGLFGGNLTQGVVDTLQAISDTYYAEAWPKVSADHLAYVYATAYHEAYHARLNPDWNPVREGFAKTNEGAINAVTRLFDQGRIRTNYALPVDGHSYYGRGLVQITWKDNYRRMGDRLSIDLVNNPDLALQRDVAAKLLVIGMIEGLYTGRSLATHTADDGTFDSFNARRIINGLDAAERIKGHYDILLTAIKAAMAG